jgi:hypothetical protein
MVDLRVILGNSEVPLPPSVQQEPAKAERPRKPPSTRQSPRRQGLSVKSKRRYSELPQEFTLADIQMLFDLSNSAAREQLHWYEVARLVKRVGKQQRPDGTWEATYCKTKEKA